MATDEVKQLLGEGAQLFKEGKLDEAIAKLKAAVEEDPSNVQAHSYLGAAYARDGQHPASVEQFQAAVDLEPDSPVHNFNLGQAFETAGSKPRAQALYEKALALDPKYARAQQRLDALTGRPAASAAPPAPRTTSMPSAPLQGAPRPMAPPAAAPLGGPSPQYGGPSQYGAQPPSGGGSQYGPQSSFDPSLGLGRRPAEYFNYSSPWKRLLAFVIDSMILGVVFVAIAFATKPSSMSMAPVPSGTATVGQVSTAMAPGLEAWIRQLQIISTVLSLAYIIGFNTACGATPGKMALGMKILKTDGSKIGFGTALGRYIIQGLVSSFTCQLGNLVIVFNGEHRGWHDQIMGTMVVDK